MTKLSEAERDANRQMLRALPGYPFLPCPICGFTGSCDHAGWERARAALPNLIIPEDSGRRALNPDTAQGKGRGE